MNQNLLDYIKKAKAGGINDEQIRQELLKAGWPSAEIEETLKVINIPGPISGTSSVKAVGAYKVGNAGKADKAKGLSSKAFFSIILAILLLAGAIFGFYMLDKQFGWGIVGLKEPIQNPLQNEGTTEEEALAAAAKCVQTAGLGGIAGPECFAEIFNIYEGRDLCAKIGQNLAVGAAGDPSCYAGLALVKNDENICGNAGEKAPECYFYLAKINKNESLCAKIDKSDLSSYSQGNCYFEMGKVKSDENLCKLGRETIPESLIAEECFRSVAASKKSPEICDNMDNKYSGRDLCYMTVAGFMGEESLCEKITDNPKGECYYNLAISKNDGVFCEKAEKSKEICYSRVAVLKNDKSLCAKAGAYKNICEKGLGK